MQYILRFTACFHISSYIISVPTRLVFYIDTHTPTRLTKGVFEVINSISLLCKYSPEPVYESHYIRIGALSLQLYASYYQHESAGNGHKSAHGFTLPAYSLDQYMGQRTSHSRDSKVSKLSVTVVCMYFTLTYTYPCTPPPPPPPPKGINHTSTSSTYQIKHATCDK